MIIKLGGSVITKKNGYKEVNEKWVEKIAEIFGKRWKNIAGKVVVINGAGSFGHAVVEKHGISREVKNDAQKLGFADVYNACNYLSTFVAQKFIDNNVPAVFIPPLAFVKQKNREVVEFKEDIFVKFLEEKYLPMSGGNMVDDLVMGKSIISGDKIISELAKRIEEKVIAFGTDVNGILDGKGEVIPYISRENFDEVKDFLTSKEGDYTGAMLGKVKEIFAMGYGKDVYIFNLQNLSQLEELLEKGKIEEGEFTLIKT